MEPIAGETKRRVVSDERQSLVIHLDLPSALLRDRASNRHCYSSYDPQ
jgi:hypothetical protein